MNRRNDCLWKTPSHRCNIDVLNEWIPAGASFAPITPRIYSTCRTQLPLLYLQHSSRQPRKVETESWGSISLCIYGFLYNINVKSITALILQFNDGTSFPQAVGRIFRREALYPWLKGRVAVCDGSYISQCYFHIRSAWGMFRKPSARMRVLRTKSDRSLSRLHLWVLVYGDGAVALKPLGPTFATPPQECHPPFSGLAVERLSR